MAAGQPPTSTGLVREIHPELRRRYDVAYIRRYQMIMEQHAGEDLEMLIVMREEITPKAIGTLTPEQRGSWRGLAGALDELIEQADHERTGS